MEIPQAVRDTLFAWWWGMLHVVPAASVLFGIYLVVVWLVLRPWRKKRSKGNGLGN